LLDQCFIAGGISGPFVQYVLKFKS